MNVKRVFIGGSRGIFYLGTIVKQQINKFLFKNYTILVGDANGGDKAVQKYLLEKNYKNVIVFCTGDKCRNNLGNWKVRHVSPNGIKTRNFFYYAQKDKKMAEEADFGFMLWNGKSRGTFNNMLNLLRLKKYVIVYLSLDNKIYPINSFETLQKWIKSHKITPPLPLP